MLIKGSVFKLILGGLFTLGLTAAAAGVIYMAFVKPYAPINLDVTVRNRSSIEDCEPVIYFMDNSLNEDEFRLYRRNLGAPAFSLYTSCLLVRERESGSATSIRTFH
jgi:hypothetical protein